MIENLAKRVAGYLEKLPPGIAGQLGHASTFRAASVLVHGFALGEEEAMDFLENYNARCLPPWSKRELRHKIRTAARARNHQHERGYLLGGEVMPQTGPGLPPVEKPQYNPNALGRLASGVSFDVTSEWLAARSTFTCWNRSPSGVLHKLYLPGEKIVVFNVFESQGGEIWEHKGLGQDLSTLDYLERGQREGVWFLCQPVDGKFH